MRAEMIIDVEALAARALARGVSQSDIAFALEVDRSTVHRWWTGETQPSDKNLAGLADVLNVKANDLLVRSEFAQTGDDW